MSDTPHFLYDVFLSYVSPDRSRVRRLAERLRDSGLRVWFDQWVIAPGENVYLASERGLKDSRALFLCLSPAALEADWVGLERSTVLFRDPANTGRHFVPVLLAEFHLPDILRNYRHVDYRRHAARAFAELLAAVGQGRGTSSILSPQPVKTGSTRSGEIGPELTILPVPTSHSMSANYPVSEPLATFDRKIGLSCEWAWSLVISPDGCWLAAAFREGVIEVVETATGQTGRLEKIPTKNESTLHYP